MQKKGSSGSKRKAAASAIDVPAERSTSVLVPEEVAALLRTVASLTNYEETPLRVKQFNISDECVL